MNILDSQPATVVENIEMTYGGMGRRASITERYGTSVLFDLMNQHLLGGFGFYKECGACGVQVRRSPAFGHTLRTNYGSDLSVFLATCPSDGVPAKMANHRLAVNAWIGDNALVYCSLG